jgi:hypothetical protein
VPHGHLARRLVPAVQLPLHRSALDVGEASLQGREPLDLMVRLATFAAPKMQAKGSYSNQLGSNRETLVRRRVQRPNSQAVLETLIQDLMEPVARQVRRRAAEVIQAMRR